MRVFQYYLLTCLLLGFVPYASAQDEDVLRIIAFGAHPDDAELKAAGVATLWAAAGHKVKFVSMTNGDIGHFEIAGGPLAQRRRAEVEECARLFGIETQVLDIHDGELMPTLENRKKVADLIRDWQADIVLCHRPYDYHADHRYTGELIQDAAVIVAAPFFSSRTPPTKKNPIILFYSDGFERPYPFDPIIAVAIDDVAQTKWDCISAMTSQFADAGSWQARTLPDIPDSEEERKQIILDRMKARNMAVADEYRDLLVKLYGRERGNSIQYAEAFELCQYGSQADVETLKKLFPTFDH